MALKLLYFLWWCVYITSTFLRNLLKDLLNLFIKDKLLRSIKFEKITQNDPYYMEVLALRYKVYCEERGYEQPCNFLDGLETDEYDEYSINFAAILEPTQEVVGTIRLILCAVEEFPVETFFELTKDKAVVPREKKGEVSRLALSREYRHSLSQQSIFCSEFDRTKVIRGLFRCVAKESLSRGISHLYAVMGRALPVLLAKERITFTQIGPEKDYHGLRAPYLGSVKEIFDQNKVLFYGCDERTH